MNMTNITSRSDKIYDAYSKHVKKRLKEIQEKLKKDKLKSSYNKGFNEDYYLE